MRDSIIEKMTERVHQWFMDGGEVYDVSDQIQRMEFEKGWEFTESELLTIVRTAGDSAMDSYIQNEHDTMSDGGNRDECWERIAYFEKMKPSNVRLAKIKAILAK